MSIHTVLTNSLFPWMLTPSHHSPHESTYSLQTLQQHALHHSVTITHFLSISDKYHDYTLSGYTHLAYVVWVTCDSRYGLDAVHILDTHTGVVSPLGLFSSLHDLDHACGFPLSYLL